jgi:adenylate kinase family enzyme
VGPVHLSTPLPLSESSETPRRIVLLGCAGTGKSSFARLLGQKLQIPVIHLDALAWRPGWQALTTEELRARLTASISGPAWITDGNYAAVTFDLRLPRADLVIWLEKPVWRCLVNVCKRAAKSYLRPDEHLAYGCEEKFDRRFLDRLKFILHFNRVNRPRIESLRVTLAPQVPVVRLNNDSEIASFLASLSNSIK